MLCKIRLRAFGYFFGRATEIRGVKGIQGLGLLHRVGDRYPKCLLDCKLSQYRRRCRVGNSYVCLCLIKTAFLQARGSAKIPTLTT